MGKKEKLISTYKLYFSRLLNTPLTKPKTVTLTLTARCNLRCIMCDHWRLKNQKELSLKKIKEIINQIEKWGIEEIELSGGEPFMRKDIWKIINYISSKGIGMNITTNGTLLSEEQIKKIFKTKVNRLQISLDGINKTQDQIRGVKGTYKKVIKTVRLINRFKKINNSNLKINATTVIMQQNLNQLVDLVKLTRNEGFDSITFQPVNDSNLTIGKKKKNNPLRVRDYKKLDKEIDKLIQIRKKSFFIGNSISYLQSIKDYFTNKKIKKIKCYAGFVGLIVTPEGKIWTCMGDFGDLKKENLEMIWKSYEAKEKRKLIKRCKNPCLYPCYLNSKGESLIKTTLGIIKNG